MKNKLLIIGPIPHYGLASTYGGATVLLKDFIDYCESNQISFSFIQTNYYLGRFNYGLNYIRLIFKLFRNILSYDIVIFNFSAKRSLRLVALLVPVLTILNKKVVVRIFGGDFVEVYNSSGMFFKKLINNYIFKSCLVVCETKKIIKYLISEELISSNNIFWHPNIRKKFQGIKPDILYSNKFVFISHVKSSKGIWEIVQAAKNLRPGYLIDIYGPIEDNTINLDDLVGNNLRYLGPVSPEKVVETLNLYDVLLLPTFYEGEGYPGIIIEAFSLGIPVITTDWKSISEVVDNNRDGLLIPIKDSNALTKAIEFFNKDNYQFFSKAAKEKFEYFDRDIVYNLYLNRLDEF